jgi:hypothetical protein
MCPFQAVEIVDVVQLLWPCGIVLRPVMSHCNMIGLPGLVLKPDSRAQPLNTLAGVRTDVLPFCQRSLVIHIAAHAVGGGGLHGSCLGSLESLPSNDTAHVA